MKKLSIFTAGVALTVTLAGCGQQNLPLSGGNMNVDDFIDAQIQGEEPM